MGVSNNSRARAERLHSVRSPTDQSQAWRGLTVGHSLESLPDMALLSAVLSMAEPGTDSDILAAKLLAGSQLLSDAVVAVARGAVPGSNLDRQAVLRFQAVIELAARLVRPSLARQPVFSDEDMMVVYCTLRSVGASVQQVRLLFLDERKQLIADELHQTGTVGEVTVYVREIIRRGLDVGARGLVVAHSTPGEEPPNPAGSRLICADLQRVGAVLGIDLYEYLLIGRRSHHCLLQPTLKPARTSAANRNPL